MMMGIKDILNYPLLRGERAERWADVLVEKPAIALGVICSLTACTLAFGLAGAAGLVLLTYTDWPRKIKQMADACTNRWEQKFSSPPQRRIKLRSYNRSAAVLEDFIKQARIKPARNLPLKCSLAFKDGPDAVKGVHHATLGLDDYGADLVVDLGGFYKKGLPRRDVEAHAIFATAHEMGHAEVEHLHGRMLLQRAQETVAVPLLVTGLASLVGMGALLVPGAAALAVAKPLVAVLPHMLACAFFTGVGYAATSFFKNVHSRQKEHRADRSAIRRTGNAPAAISYFSRNVPVASIRPSFAANVFQSHPCKYNRIREISFYNNSLKNKTRAPSAN